MLKSVPGKSGDFQVPAVSLPALLQQRLAAWADRVAYVEYATGRKITYGDLAIRIRRTAAGLRAVGVNHGSVLALIAPNQIDFVVAYHAAIYAGAAVTTLNPLSTPAEIVHQLQQTGAQFVITTRALDLALAQFAQAPTRRWLLGDSGDRGFETLIGKDEMADPVVVDPARDLAALPFSSGTSGAAKPVMLTHRNIAAALVASEMSAEIDKDDVILAVLPFFHIYGMVVLANAVLLNGACTIILPYFDLEMFLRAIQERKVTLCAVVAPILLTLAKHPLVDHFDLTSLRQLTSSATPLSREVAVACSTRIGCPITSAYGMTECPIITMNDADPSPQVVDSCGRAIPGVELRLIDLDTGADVPSGLAGEILIRSPMVTSGYLGESEATAAALLDGGWLRTGDVGTLDTQGYLRIIDRSKEFIKYKGFQVSPSELEGVLLGHAAVADAAVVASPDVESGEAPKAFVVRKGDVSAADLIAYVGDHVAPYKRVREIEFIDAIPKSPAGKILRRKLTERERAADETRRSSPNRLEGRVVIDSRDGIMTIMLDRPRKMNGFDLDMFLGLARALTMAEEDHSVRCTIIHGAGTVFSSGLDIVSMAPLLARGELRFSDELVDIVGLGSGRKRTKPAISAVHGRCMNFGMELLLATDFAVASSDTIFAQQEVLRGVFPFGGATVRLPQRIGLGNALRIMLTAEAFDASEALRMGLIQTIAEPGQHVVRAMDLAKAVAAAAPLCIRATLASTRQALIDGETVAMSALIKSVKQLTITNDFQEGVRAFVERRVPVFEGR